MLLRTHYAIAVFFILLFIESVESQVVFVLAVLVGTQLPDIDSRYSRIGHKRIARVLQWFTRHRGIIHSFPFLLVVTILLVAVWPVGAFGFFLGYSLHLLGDAFTPDGIRPFYPLKKKSRGTLRTGGTVELALFVGFVIVDVLLIFGKVF